MKKLIVMIASVVTLAPLCTSVHAEDKTSFGVEFVSIRERLPFKVTSNPDTYKYISSNSYVTTGPKLTLVRKNILFEVAAQTPLSTPRMENISYVGDKMEINSAYIASAILGVVLHESFIPYVGGAYSRDKFTYKGNYSSSASFSTSGNDKTTQFAVGARSRIPIAKMISIYGDGMYSWVDSKTGIDQTVTIRSISQPTVTHDSSSGHSKGFTIDVGFEFTPVTNITVRTLVGIDRSKEGGEPESESTSYTVGLLYNF